MVNKYEPRGISCNITPKTYQDILKNANLLHKRSFDDYQSSTTVMNKHQINGSTLDRDKLPQKYYFALNLMPFKIYKEFQMIYILCIFFSSRGCKKSKLESQKNALSMHACETRHTCLDIVAQDSLIFIHQIRWRQYRLQTKFQKLLYGLMCMRKAQYGL